MLSDGLCHGKLAPLTLSPILIFEEGASAVVRALVRVIRAIGLTLLLFVAV
jgi:hypothetical protein